MGGLWPALKIIAFFPYFFNSKITFIDGEKGVLQYRGYPIEDLANHSTHLEVCYLLLHGELPSETDKNELKAL